MKNLNIKKIVIISALVDPLLLIISFLIARKAVFIDEMPPNLYFITPLIGFIGIWWLSCMFLELYDNSKNLHAHEVLSKNTLGLIVFSLASTGFIFLTTDYKYSRLFLIYALSIFGILLLLWRILSFLIEKKNRVRLKYLKRAVIVGRVNKIGDDLEKIYNNPLWGYNLSAVFCDEKKEIEENFLETKIERLDNAEEYLLNNKVDQLILVLNNEDKTIANKLLSIADNNLIRVHIVPEFLEHFSQRFTIDYFNSLPVLKMRDEPLMNVKNRILKRGLDLFFALLIVTFIFPILFPIIALAIKLTSKGPLFFIQERTGLEGNSFNCYKFRTMFVNSDSDHIQATKNDKRVTKVGEILRKTSMDELPQIFNVIQSHMSLVGPRPHMLKHTEEYKQIVNKFMVRHFAKPGITGWAQIHGFRGETKEIEDMRLRADADIWYIENWSIFLDIKIIFETAKMILFKKEENAY